MEIDLNGSSLDVKNIIALKDTVTSIKGQLKGTAPSHYLGPILQSSKSLKHLEILVNEHENNYFQFLGNSSVSSIKIKPNEVLTIRRPWLIELFIAHLPKGLLYLDLKGLFLNSIEAYSLYSYVNGCDGIVALKFDTLSCSVDNLDCFAFLLSKKLNVLACLDVLNCAPEIEKPIVNGLRSPNCVLEELSIGIKGTLEELSLSLAVSKLKKLRISEYDGQDQSFSGFLVALSKSGVVDLSFQGSKIGDTRASLLFKGGLGKITHLNLDGNELTRIGSLEPGVLKVLNLSNNPRIKDWSDLCNKLEDIESLVVDGCRWTDPESFFRGSGIKRSLSAKRSQHIVIPSILKLVGNSSITHLDLEGDEENKMNLSAIGFNESISGNCLVYLRLSRNKLDDRQIDDILEGLKGSKTLRELYLDHNKIADIGAMKLSELRGLKTLDLSYNEIHEYGVKQLLRLVSDGIKLLDVSHNQSGSVPFSIKDKLNTKVIF